MKPTEAGTDKYSPVINKPKTPPIKDKGTLINIKVALRSLPNDMYNSKYINR